MSAALCMSIKSIHSFHDRLIQVALAVGGGLFCSCSSLFCSSSHFLSSEPFRFSAQIFLRSNRPSGLRLSLGTCLGFRL